MAQRIQVLVEDDLDGSEADGTIRFGLDGSDYEIDLNTAHADALRNVFAPYVAVARKVAFSRPSRPGRTKAGNARSATVSTGPSNTEVREWAKAQGLEVKDRGRIPMELVAKFEESKKVPQVQFSAGEPGSEDKPEPNGDKPTERKRAPRKTKES